MVGISRKSMIYKTLETDPSEALTGTTAAHMAALLGGASILRVHDVKEAVETVKIFRQIVNKTAVSSFTNFGIRSATCLVHSSIFVFLM